jgi:hypothetical protein
MPRELSTNDIFDIELRLGHSEKVELSRDEALELIRFYKAFDSEEDDDEVTADEGDDHEDDN